MSCPRCGHTVVIEDHRKHYICAKCDKIVTESLELLSLPVRLRKLAREMEEVVALLEDRGRLSFDDYIVEIMRYTAAELEGEE